MSKKKIIILSIITVLIIAGLLIIPKINHYIEWKQAEAAASSMPYQIGLTNVITDMCRVQPMGTAPPQCWGTKQQAAAKLCMTLTSQIAKCPLYTEVNGTKAGGMGNQALFLNTAIAKAGVSDGGQLIAGGMSLVLMDSGVLAGKGGCFGCK